MWFHSIILCYVRGTHIESLLFPWKKREGWAWQCVVPLVRIDLPYLFRHKLGYRLILYFCYFHHEILYRRNRPKLYLEITFKFSFFFKKRLQAAHFSADCLEISFNLAKLTDLCAWCNTQHCLVGVEILRRLDNHN